MHKSTFDHARKFAQQMESQSTWTDEDVQRLLFYLDESLIEIDRAWKGMELGLGHPLHTWSD